MHVKTLQIGLCSLLGTMALGIPAQPNHACGVVLDPVERLACYDLAFPPTKAVIDAAADRGERQFGLNVAAAAVGARGAEVDQHEITSRITRVLEARDGQRTITLENGQVWRLDGNRGVIAEGDGVILRKAALGTHMAVMPSGVRLRARRLQ